MTACRAPGKKHRHQRTADHDAKMICFCLLSKFSLACCISQLHQGRCPQPEFFFIRLGAISPLSPFDSAVHAARPTERRSQNKHLQCSTTAAPMTRPSHIFSNGCVYLKETPAFQYHKMSNPDAILIGYPGHDPLLTKASPASFGREFNSGHLHCRIFVCHFCRRSCFALVRDLMERQPARRSWRSMRPRNTSNLANLWWASSTFLARLHFPSHLLTVAGMQQRRLQSMLKVFLNTVRFKKLPFCFGNKTS